MDWISSSSSSDSDDFKIEEMLFDDDIEHMIMAHLVEQFETGGKRKRQGSKVGCLCIPRYRALGSAMLMKDYFAEVRSGSPLP